MNSSESTLSLSKILKVGFLAAAVFIADRVDSVVGQEREAIVSITNTSPIDPSPESWGGAESIDKPTAGSLEPYLLLKHWPHRPDIPPEKLPTKEQLHAAVEACREASVMVEIRIHEGQEKRIDASHSGFFVEMENLDVTREGKKWKFVLTCAHGLDDYVAPEICVVTANGQELVPTAMYREPEVDLLLLQFPIEKTQDIRGLSLAKDQLPSFDDPALLFSSRILRVASSHQDFATKKIVRIMKNNPRDQVVLATIEKDIPVFPDYRRESTILTNESLSVGGSGSAVVAWFDGVPRVIAVQVRRMPNPQATNERVDGLESSYGIHQTVSVALDILNKRGFIQSSSERTNKPASTLEPLPSRPPKPR